MSRLPFVILSLSVSFSAGCIDFSSTPSADNTPAKPPATENSGQGIFGKTTQEIGEHDKNKANQVTSDQKIHATDPFTAPLSAYGPMTESIAKTKIKAALNYFYGENERYPNDHEEFMEKVVKPNNIELPVLPYKGRYQYDVEKHELMIVRNLENAEQAK
jgi:hypothetical protein